MAPKVSGQPNIDWSRMSSKMGNTLSQCTGNEDIAKFSTTVGDALSGNSDAIITNATNGLVDNLIENPVANAAVKTTIDIVKTVLMGQYQKGVDKLETQKAAKEIKNTSNTMVQMGDSTDAKAKDLSSTAQQAIDGYSIDITNNQVIIKDALTETEVTVKDKTEENEKVAEQIQKNQTEINQKQQRMQEIANQIKQNQSSTKPHKAEHKSTPTKAPQQQNQDGTSVDGNKQTQMFTQSSDESQQTPVFNVMELDGVNDSLIQEYNSLGVEVQELMVANQTMTSSIIDDNAQIVDVKDQATQVTDETSQQIDDATNQIVSTLGNTKAAIDEVTNLLKGNFPKLDQVTLIKLSGEMVKATINGTESGLLATAAATMGVGSLFSFGATASKAAELSAASADKASGSAARIATNVAGKVSEQFAMNSIKYVLSNIPGIGSELSQYTDQLVAQIQNGNQENETLKGNILGNSSVSTPTNNNNSPVTKPSIPQTDDNQNKKQMA